MAKDLTYTNGVIAVREKYLLKDKISKLCEGGAEEAFRSLTECGFGRGADAASVYEYEKLVEADERSIDEFIREYSPSRAETEYLLCARDFHNAKALVKAEYLKLDIEKMLAPDGIYPVETIERCIKENNFEGLSEHLADAIVQAEAALSSDASGAEVGIIFEKAYYAHIVSRCSKNLLLRRLIAAKADMTNILTALRSDSAEYAEHCFVDGGKLSKALLLKLFDEDKSAAAQAFEDTPYSEFVKSGIIAKSNSQPLTHAEKMCECYEAEFFAAKKYELKASQPFLYYVFSRRAENADVRILFVCLLAGMRESEIKRRLRTVQV